MNNEISGSPFYTFWQAGYEGADHVNRARQPLSMNLSTGHIAQAYQDYGLLREFGIRTVRESVGWRSVEINGRFDFASLKSRVEAAQKLDIQICWTFCHYGWPDDIDVFSREFVFRFARFCRAVTQYLAPYSTSIPIYSPINEISFTSWGLSVQLFHFPSMFDERAVKEGKCQLVRAAVAGCDAIWEIAPNARILHCDPVIHVIAPLLHEDGSDNASDITASQYDAWDMLCGKKNPELGGHPRYLDLIGANYYHDNQWEHGTNVKLAWHIGDPRRQPLHKMLIDLHQRYRRPILLAETSHIGSGRGAWVRHVAEESALALQNGAEFLGINLYPAVDRHDWENDQHWHHSGLWDVCYPETELVRKLPLAYAKGLRQAQKLIKNLYSQTNSRTGKERDKMPCIIVFSHLRWDFVYQRPQQILTRLAEHYRVILIEEPVFCAGESYLEVNTPFPNVSVYRAHTSVQKGGFHDDQIAIIQSLLDEMLGVIEKPIVWFYTPMALPFLSALDAGLVIYDCMDELSGFKNAPRQLLQREKALLNLADIVFTGGRSLHEAKRQMNSNVHCFPSSVDSVHFEQALDSLNRHPLQEHLVGPLLGFYGVIDERIDLELLAALADANCLWQIIMVGPVVKIDPASLPQRRNIHYFGQQPYQALPQFLADWDVCLMPFALNEATRFISPTKVLEYMAAELPIVSTHIKDVADPYGNLVSIAKNSKEFIEMCEEALLMSSEEKCVVAARMRAVVAATSWEETVDAMREILETACSSASGISRPHPLSTTVNITSPTLSSISQDGRVTTTRQGVQAKVANVSCAIIGAGPTGLSAAYHLGEDTLLLERHSTVGGWCRSVCDNGFTFDYAGHIMFSNDEYVLSLYDILLGDNQHWQNREAWVYSKQVHTRYPFQGALYGLPPEVIKECIIGAVEALYEAPAALVNPSSPLQAPAVGADKKQAILSFEEFIYKVWGAGIAKHFAIPYNKKLWTVPLNEMETSWLGGRVPLPKLDEIIEGALQPVAKPMGPNARFGYPLKGGFQALVSGFVPHIRGQIELNADVVEILPFEHIIVLADGRQFQYETLISTMPLPELVKLIGVQAPKQVREAADALHHISVRCVNIGVAREKISDKHWIYYPEDTIFHRIFLQGNASPDCNPPGGFGFTCEISYSPWKPLPLEGEALIARCIQDCIEVGMITAEDKIISANCLDLPYAYVIYDNSRADSVATVKAWMKEYDIVLAGRYSEWEYYNSDHAFLAGRKAAETVTSRTESITSSMVVES